MRRLDAAVAGLEAVASGRDSVASASGDVPGLPLVDAEDLAALRSRCAVLETAVLSASRGIDDTVARLKRLLEG